jgi:dTDP-4-dehydrorhamnose reductase
MSERVLVMGVTGMLGHVVARELAARHEVRGTARDPARARRLGIEGELEAVEASDPVAVEAVLDETRPDVVVNAVGLVKQLEDASRPIPAITVNALFPHWLAEACAARGARLIHISTDCVFSGALPAPAAYTEDDVSDARDVYGRTKFLGETVQPPALTLRTSIIGWELERASGLLEWFAAQEGRTIDGFANAIFSGLTTRALARVIGAVIDDHRSLSGLYHVSSEPISKLTLLTALRDALAVACEIRPADEPRINRALDSSRFRRATDIEIPSWPAMIDEYRRERDHDTHP